MAVPLNFLASSPIFVMDEIPEMQPIFLSTSSKKSIGIFSMLSFDFARQLRGQPHQHWLLTTSLETSWAHKTEQGRVPSKHWEGEANSDALLSLRYSLL